jgi:hypothetical protein
MVSHLAKIKMIKSGHETALSVIANRANTPKKYQVHSNAPL